MNYRIILDAPFKKEVKRLAKKYHSLKRDLEVLQDELLANPQAGVDLGGGLRKVRMAIASKGRGKSHGARVPKPFPYPHYRLLQQLHSLLLRPIPIPLQIQ